VVSNNKKLIAVIGATAIRAAKDAGVKHLLWSTLPDVEVISGAKFKVPHFIGKAKIDATVQSRSDLDS